MHIFEFKNYKNLKVPLIYNSGIGYKFVFIRHIEILPESGRKQIFARIYIH